MAKKLKINCATCDARKIAEENYSHYEQISLNCVAMLTCPEAKAVMSRLPITLNCSDVLEVEGDVALRTVSGKAEIKGSDAISAEKYYMTVNGSLTIDADAERQLEQCIGMSVNGSLVCPESIFAKLHGVKVNGSTCCYPDGAIVLKRNAVIDRLFALRAKNRLYWAARRLIMVDPELDAQKLKSKGASFRSAEAIIAESKTEALIDLIDDKTDIVIVPDGTTVLLDDVTLDAAALSRCGDKLYIVGDVTVPGNGEVLDKLSYLNVRGDVRVSEELKDKLLSVLSDISGDIKLMRRGTLVLEDRPLVKLTKRMLEQQPQGIDVVDCAAVKIADDIPAELILERLHIEDCAVVRCSEELEDAVCVVCSDVADIRTGDADSDADEDIKDSLGGLLGSLDTRVINAADYVL